MTRRASPSRRTSWSSLYDPCKDLTARDPRGHLTRRPRRASLGAGEERERADRFRENEAQRALLLLVGPGLRTAPRDGDALPDDRSADDPRALQGHRAEHHRRRGRTHRDDHRERHLDTADVHFRQASRAGVVGRERMPALPEFPDHRRVGRAGLRLRQLVRPVPARRYRQGHQRRRCRKRSPRTSSSPTPARCCSVRGSTSRQPQEEFTKMYAAEIPRWAKVVKAVGLQANSKSSAPWTSGCQSRFRRRPRRRKAWSTCRAAPPVVLGHGRQRPSGHPAARRHAKRAPAGSTSSRSWRRPDTERSRYSRRGYYRSDPGDPDNPGIGVRRSAPPDPAPCSSAPWTWWAPRKARSSRSITLLDYPDRVRSLAIVSSYLGITDADYAAVNARLRPEFFATLPHDFQELSPSYRAGNPEGLAAWNELRKAGDPGQADNSRKKAAVDLGAAGVDQAPGAAS